MSELASGDLRLQYLDNWWHQAMDNKGGGQKRDVRAVVPYPLTAAGHFSREDVFSKIGKWFSKELQVGDAAFDAAIYIKTDDPDAAEGAGGPAAAALSPDRSVAGGRPAVAHRAVVGGHAGDGRLEWYNLADDPGERRDLVAAGESPPRALAERVVRERAGLTVGRIG